MSYIIYFIITIGILVFVHEFGHFAAAKLTKMRVDVFAIGFGKRLFGWNKLKGFTFGDLPTDFDGQGNTDYRLCLLPLGGYVKIAGMVDESMDVKFADAEPQPYEFRAKPIYQKVIVITAGVFMNLLLAFLVFWAVNFFQAKQYMKTTTVGYVEDKSPAAKAGFQVDDKILTINGESVSHWEEVYSKIFIDNIGENINITVLRNGAKEDLRISKNTFSADFAKNLYLLPKGQNVIFDSVFSGTPANQAGFVSGDIVLKINNKPIVKSTEVVEIISDSKNKTLPVTVQRDKDTLTIAVTPNAEGKIGVSIGNIYTGEVASRSMGLFEAMWTGVTDIGKYTILTFNMIKKVIYGNIEFSSAFGGPVKIAQFAAKSADTGFLTFIFFLAMLSLSLAIINILPFPVLDGGHLVIILIEGLILQREIPLKIKVAIQNTGFIILLLFMAFIIYNDIISL